VSSARLGRFMKDLCAEEIAKLASQLTLEREEATTVPQPVLSPAAVAAANDPSASHHGALVESGSDLTPSELRGAPMMPTPGPVDYSSSVTEVPIDEVAGKGRPGVALAIVAGLVAMVGLGAGGWYMLEKNAAEADDTKKAAPKVIVAPEPIADPDEQPKPKPTKVDTVDMSPGDPQLDDAAEVPPVALPPEPEPDIEIEDSAEAADDGTSEPDPEEDSDPAPAKRPRRPATNKKSTKPPPTTSKKKPQWDPNVGMPGL
jgi:hypothetical protein